MKNIILSIFSIFSFSNSYCQSLSTSDLTKKWELTEGWFPKENIEFTETKADKLNYAFQFKEDGAISYLGSLESMSCPVGEFTLRDGNWKLDKNILTLELRGLKIADFWYWWIISYNVKMDGNKLKLGVKQIIKHREISPTKTWKELIKK